MKHVIAIFLLLLLHNYGFSQNAASVKQPSLMVVPSDKLLRKLHYGEFKKNQGKDVFIADYKKSIVEDDHLAYIIGGINQKFADENFPIESLEQTLKSIDFDAARNNIEDYEEDPLGLILQQARPDIILKLDYDFERGNIVNQFSFQLEALDSYTNKSVAGAQDSKLKTAESSIKVLMDEAVERNMNNFKQNMEKHFQDLRVSGREVKVQFKLAKNTTFRLDEINDTIGDIYADYIQGWIKKNTVNGQFKRLMSSPTTLVFTNVRIPLYDKDGLGLGLDEWLKPLRIDIIKKCSITAKDRTQSLGDGLVELSDKK
jgi:Family of unknown function (DUF6175)